MGLNHWTALKSAWRAFLKQYRKRMTELRRDQAETRVVHELGEWTKLATGTHEAAEALKASRDAAKRNEVRYGPQDAAS